MNIRIDSYTVQKATLAVGAGFLVYLAWLGVSMVIRKQNTQSSCERECRTLKSEIFHNRCYCATSAGWTPAGKAQWVDRKVKGRR